MVDAPEWRANPGPQVRALRSIAFETLMGGARGGAKTETGLVWLTRHVANRRYRALVVRRNADDLADWLDRANRMYYKFGARQVGKPVTIRFPSGALIRCGHLHDEESFGKYLGHEYQRMVIEELTQIPTEKRYLQLIASCRTTIPEIPARVFATTNPGGAGHSWVRSRFVDGAAPGTMYADPETGRTRLFVPARVDDCPQLLQNDPGYVAFLDGLKSTDPQLWRAWRLGDWDVFAGQYFSMWRRDLHVCEPFQIPAGWTRWTATDYGFAAPWVTLWFARSPDDRRIYVYREIARTGVYSDEQARILRETSKGERIARWFGDPSMFNQRREDGKPSIAWDYQAEGIPLERAQNDRLIGWSAVKRALASNETGKPRLQIFSTCTGLIRTLPLMQHDRLNVEDLADVINSSKTEDDWSDALRYGLLAEAAPSEEAEAESVMGRR